MLLEKYVVPSVLKQNVAIYSISTRRFNYPSRKEIFRPDLPLEAFGNHKTAWNLL